MTFLIGQSVSFETRKGTDEGVKGTGVIVSAEPGRTIVRYTYVINEGPFAGNEVTSTVECLDSELTRLADYRIQVQDDDNGGWTTLRGSFHESEARKWVSTIERHTGERAVIILVEWV